MATLISPLYRRDFAAAKGSNDYTHLQEQFVTTFSNWSEICNSFDVIIIK